MPYRRRLIADSLLPVVERIHYFLQMVLMMGAPPNVIDGPRRGCVEPQKTTVTSEIITFGPNLAKNVFQRGGSICLNVFKPFLTLLFRSVTLRPELIASVRQAVCGRTDLLCMH